MSGRPTLDRALAVSPALQERRDVSVPAPPLLTLPETAVQFGTGAFLRGFVDFFLDEANRKGCFGGRVVAVSSTESGRDAALNAQDGLYTLVARGVRDGEAVERLRVVGSVSRALSAATEWDAVLSVARAPELRYVFSNTTEVGIVLDPEDRAELSPPRSFPGKLARFLVERARATHCDPARGVVVLPCELIDDNGTRLRDLVLALLDRWGIEVDTRRWVAESVPFCNTLVDRIVPGAPRGDDAERLAQMLGYDDALLTTAELYRLFVIEAPEGARDRLAFAHADSGILAVSDATPYRTRKVRILNGAHTSLVPLALLRGCRTVRAAVEDPQLGHFLRVALFDEIVPVVEAPGAAAFAREVLERFANPYIEHMLFDITLQGTMKMRVRVVPTILAYAARFGQAPRALTLGFAAHLAFLRGELQAARRARGERVPADDQGEAIAARWGEVSLDAPAALASFVRELCADTSLWGADLTVVPGFVHGVTQSLERIWQSGAGNALEAMLAEVPA